jgi:23S rRNA pseudouridine2605 synthase
MRLNKFLSQAGIASRRHADILIAEGHVAINGQIVTELGTQVNEAADKVTVDGKDVRLVEDYTYILLHKPAGYLVTRKDEFGRPTVLALIGKYRNIVKPVGRLDFNSSGLLFLTNNGELAFRLTHPRFLIDKAYLTKCEGLLTDANVSKLESGVTLDDGITAPAKVQLISRSEHFSSFKITIHEGRKRQIRLMCQAIRHPVISLKRLAFGNLTLGDLKSGRYRTLTESELSELKRLVSL